MFLINDRVSGEGFLCERVTQKRGWTTMVDPELIHSFQEGQLYTVKLPGKLSYRESRLIMVDFGPLEEDIDEVQNREVIKYTPPVPLKNKKWWQFWQ